MTGVLYACLKEQGNLQLYSTNNCLNLMRSSSCLRLDVKNPEVDRVKSTIRIVDFPRRTKAYDIQVRRLTLMFDLACLNVTS